MAIEQESVHHAKQRVCDKLEELHAMVSAELDRALQAGSGDVATALHKVRSEIQRTTNELCGYLAI